MSMRRVNNGYVGGVVSETPRTHEFVSKGEDRVAVQYNLKTARGFVNASAFYKKDSEAAKYAESMRPGQALLVRGSLTTNEYKDKNGNNASSIEVLVDSYFGTQYTGTKEKPQAIDINKFFIGGNLVDDPAPMSKGLRGSIAQNDGDNKTTYLNWLAFDEQVVKVLSTLKKGAEVVLEVSIANGSYTKKGTEQKVQTGRVIVTAVHGYMAEDATKQPADAPKAETPKEESKPVKAEEAKPETEPEAKAEPEYAGVDDLGINFDDIEL